MKHLKKLVALAMVAATILAVAVPAMAATTTKYVSAPQGPGYTVNIRQSKSTSSTKLDAPTHGSAIYVSADDGTWSTVSYYNPNTAITSNGYMQSAYLVSSVPSNAPWIVRYGSRDIKSSNTYNAGCVNLQKDLNTKMGAGLAEDGYCGPNTVTVIRSFQGANNLVVDGVAGNRTKEYLYKLTH